MFWIQEHTGKQRKTCSSNVAVREEQRSHIPIEIVIEILARLPVKSLLKFRLVCRLWRSIIDDQHFIGCHLQNTHSNLRGLNIISLLWSCPKGGMLSLSYFFEDSRQYFNIMVPTLANYYRTSNSCDGLICIFTERYTCVVNPSIRKVLELPEAPKGLNNDQVNIALVRGAAANEYKVVRTFVRGERTSGCMIFTLGRSSSWRLLVAKPPLPITDYGIPVVVNETIYWNISGRIFHTGPKVARPKVAISFDIKKETFDAVVHPECSWRYQSTSVHQLGGCLCIFENPGSSKWLQKRLWILKDQRYNVWVKHDMNLETMENLSPAVANLTHPVEIHGGKVLMSNKESRLDLYDPVTGRFEKPFYVDHGPFTPYMESLISPIEIQKESICGGNILKGLNKRGNRS